MGPRVHWIGTDYLRALAILLVLGIHFFGFRAFALHLGRDDIPWPLRIFGHGYYGVSIFFVISGFLITSTSVTCDGAGRLGIAAKRFYIRRVTRILPLLLLTILVAVSGLLFATAGTVMHRAVFAADGATFTPGFWAAIATFSFNWYRIVFAGPDGWGMAWDVLWSLAIEEQFYLLFPFAIALLATRKRAIAAMGIVIVAATLLRVALVGAGVGWLGMLTNSLTCFDALAMGSLLALLRPWPRHRRVAAWYGGGALMLVSYLFRPMDGWGLPVLGMGLATALLIQSGRTAAPGRPVLAPVADFGRMSYGLYLLHPLCLFVIGPWALRMPPVVGFLSFVAVSYLVAKASFILFERPVERLGREVLLKERPRRVPAGLAWPDERAPATSFPYEDHVYPNLPLRVPALEAK